MVKLRREGALTRQQVQDLVAGAVRGMEPAAVRVLLAQAAPAGVKTPALVRVGPFSVAPGSRPMLLVILSVGLLMIITLCGLVIYLLRRPRTSVVPEEPMDPELESSLSLLTRTFRRK